MITSKGPDAEKCFQYSSDIGMTISSSTSNRHEGGQYVESSTAIEKSFFEKSDEFYAYRYYRPRSIGDVEFDRTFTAKEYYEN